MLQKNKFKKILGISFLTFVLGLSAACGNNSSSETPSSETPSSSESSVNQPSSEIPVADPIYKVVIGEVEIELTKGENGIYSTTIESVIKNTEIKFYKDSQEIYPGCAELGNNIILNDKFKTVVNNDASNVTLTLTTSADGAEVWLTGFESSNVAVFSAKVNGESVDVTKLTNAPSGYVASLKVTLAIGDVVVIYGDDTPLYIGESAAHYETEYTAPLPGEYVINVNEYNRIVFIEPVLSVEELYLTYVNEELIEPTFVTPDNPEYKAQFSIDLKKGQEFVVKYIDGTSLGGESAVLDCSYTIYIKQDGDCETTMSNVNLNIAATMDGQPLELDPKPADENFAVYRITVEAGKEIVFFNDGEALKYEETSETSFTREEAGVYTVYINSSLQVWVKAYSPAVYTTITVTGVNPKLLENRNLYVWAWPTNKDGSWVDESPIVNQDGTISVYIPEGCDNFLLITTFAYKAADWNNVKSQTNDIKIVEGTTTMGVTWKTQENVSGGSSQPGTQTPAVAGNYGLRGTFDGGDWGTTTLLTKVTDDLYELEINATEAAEFKVVSVKADDVTYVVEWIGNNGEANFQLQPGSYKVSYTVSTKTVVITSL